MPDKNTRWQNDKEWAGWTIRDEIYAFIRRNLGQTVVTSIIFLGGAIWAFVKEHPLVWEPVGGAALAVGAITGLALYDGRKRKRVLKKEQAPLTPIRTTTPAVAMHAAEINVAIGPSNQLSTQSSEINPTRAVDRLLAGVPLDSVLEHSEEEWRNLQRIYDFDERRNLLTLKVSLPDDGAREEKALLLLVYGYRVLKGVNDVLIERLRTGLRESGYHRNIPGWQVMTGQTIDFNIDALASEYVRVGALQLHGLLNDGVYSITEDGKARARDILKAIIPILD
jgi:hypothetical protein